MDIRQKARDLKKECEGILTGAESEGRTLNEEEQTRYDAKFGELTGALDQSRRSDELAVVSAGLAEPSTPSVGPTGAMPPEEQTRDDQEVEVRVVKDRAAERGCDNVG